MHWILLFIHFGVYRFQEFYEEGEREILLEEVSKLREQVFMELENSSKIQFYFCLFVTRVIIKNHMLQLLQFLDGKFMMQNLPNANSQPQVCLIHYILQSSYPFLVFVGQHFVHVKLS